MSRAATADARCVVHPTRPAADACPVCARPRCGVDADRWGTAGCAACTGASRRPAHPPGDGELLVRAGLAATAAALAGGFVATEYVGTRYFSVVAPGLVGLAAAWAVSAAAGPVAGRRRAVLLVVAAAAAIVGTALGFRLVPGGQSLFTPWGDVGPPYLAAVVGVVVWPAVFGSGPRRDGRRRGQPGGRGSDS